MASILGTYTSRKMNLNNITYYDWPLFSKPYPNCFSDASTYHDATYPDVRALMQAYDRALERLKSDKPKFDQYFHQYGVSPD